MTAKIFIDGHAGTTGLQIRDRLAARDDIEFLLLADAERKNAERRRDALNSCDIAILCLPDAAAVEAVSFIENEHVRVVDASTAHRVADDWVYGLPEYTKGHADRVKNAKRVSNPGCYPTGPILFLYPLIEAGILPKDYPISVSAISGYSGGGNALIERFQNEAAEDHIASGGWFYGLTQSHKHLSEMQHYTGLDRKPIFMPSVGQFAQGMLCHIPIYLDLLNKRLGVQEMRDFFADYYQDRGMVRVILDDGQNNLPALEAESLAGSDEIHLYVLGNEAEGRITLTSLYDNLGKGASGAAVQNVNLLLQSL